MKAVNIWKNTKTIDEYLDGFTFTKEKGKAEIALIGSKTIDLNEFPKLRMLFRTGISTADLPFQQAKERNITIKLPSKDIANIIYEETADFTCSLIFKTLYIF